MKVENFHADLKKVNLPKWSIAPRSLKKEEVKKIKNKKWDLGILALKTVV
jgi:hypothetical protein